MLQGEPLGSGEGQIVNKSKSGFEGLSRVKWGNGENKGQSRGSEARKGWRSEVGEEEPLWAV